MSFFDSVETYGYNIVHCAFFQALHAYKKKHGSLPKPYNKEDSAKFLEAVKEVNEGAKAKVCVLAISGSFCI